MNMRRSTWFGVIATVFLGGVWIADPALGQDCYPSGCIPDYGLCPCEGNDYLERFVFVRNVLTVNHQLHNCWIESGTGVTGAVAVAGQNIDRGTCPAAYDCGACDCIGPVYAMHDSQNDSGDLFYDLILSTANAWTEPECTVVNGSGGASAEVTSGSTSVMTDAMYLSKHSSRVSQCTCVYGSEGGVAVGKGYAEAKWGRIVVENRPCQHYLNVYLDRTFFHSISNCDGSEFVLHEDERYQVVNFLSMTITGTDTLGQPVTIVRQGVFGESAAEGTQSFTRMGIFDDAAFDPATWTTSGSRSVEVPIDDSGMTGELDVTLVGASFAEFGDFDDDGTRCSDDRMILVALADAETAFNTAGYDARADFDLNGVIDAEDVRLFDEAEVINDCNSDGFADECDPDCNTNGASDVCEILDGAAQDCNLNGVPDSCDIATGESADSDGSGVPDECEFCTCPGDVKPSHTVDSSDYAAIDICINDPDSTVYDCRCADMDGDGEINKLDKYLIELRITCDQSLCGEPFTDCNNNNVSDACEIKTGYAPDKNDNGVPDECEVCECPGDIKVNGAVDIDDVYVIRVCIKDPDNSDYACSCADMDGSGVIDSKDQKLLEARVHCGDSKCTDVFADCNLNNVDDRCEIKQGIAADANKNGIPDECE